MPIILKTELWGTRSTNIKWHTILYIMYIRSLIQTYICLSYFLQCTSVIVCRSVTRKVIMIYLICQKTRWHQKAKLACTGVLSSTYPGRQYKKNKSNITHVRYKDKTNYTGQLRNDTQRCTIINILHAPLHIHFKHR